MTTTEPVAGPPQASPTAGGTTSDPDAPVVTGAGQVRTAERTSAPPAVEFGYVPGFDGLRGYVLIVMLAYHHGVKFVKGGIFAVSMFFVLSGFLIASLTLKEWAKRDDVSLPKFWERRARRLLPAALVTLVLVVGLQYVFHVGSSPRFRGDLLGALFYGANWRFAYSGADYSSLFQIEAPVQHFWSLSIEEQFYLLFPLMFVGVLFLARRRWGLVGGLFAAGTAVTFAWAWHSSTVNGNTGITYYSTFTRVSECLAGVTFAFVLASRPARRALATTTGARLVAIGGVVGIAGWLFLWHYVPLTSEYMFHGGTILNFVFTALVIMACLRPVQRNPANRLFNVAIFCALGRLTYGIYLYHWPIYLLLSWERLGWIGYWPLFIVRAAASIGLAALSLRFLEEPFRERMKMPPRRLALGFVVAVAVVAALIIVVPVHESRTVDLAAAARETKDSPLVPDVAVPLAPESGGPAPQPAARILLVGDSVVYSAMGGYKDWNATHGEQLHVDAYFAVACTLSKAGTMHSLGLDEQPTPTCGQFRDDLPAALDRADYDAIIVTMGQKDLGEKFVDGQWRHLGDPVFDDWLAPQVGEIADLLAAEDTPVFWSEATKVRIARANDPSSHWQDFPDNDPARVDRLNEIVRSELDGRDNFQMLPTEDWLQRLPGGEFNPDYRADGVHYTQLGADAFARWVVPQVLAAKDGG
jgi:peptidoglycan/LPS O-acetylase OafA/YrhL